MTFFTRTYSLPTYFESELYYDRRSVGQSVLVSSLHLGLMTRFLLLSDHCGFLTRGRICLLQCTMYNIQYILLSQIWDSPNLEDQVPVFISPRNRVVWFIPLGTGLILSDPTHFNKKIKIVLKLLTSNRNIQSEWLLWFGHVVMMPETSCARSILEEIFRKKCKL
jgi:hypothetical protein